MAGIKPKKKSDTLEGRIDNFINPSLKPVSKRQQDEQVNVLTIQAIDYLNKNFSFVIQVANKPGQPNLLLLQSFTGCNRTFKGLAIWLKPKGMLSASSIQQEAITELIRKEDFMTFVTDDMNDLKRNVNLYYQR